MTPSDPAKNSKFIDSGLGKIPPCDIDSEEALLGSLLYNPRSLFEIRALLDEGDVFYKLDLGDYYKAILTVFDSGQPIRPLTVMQQLRKTGRDDLLNYLPPNVLINKGIGVEAYTTALYLRELYIQRLLIGQASELIRSVYSHESLDIQISLTTKLTQTLSGKMAIAANKPIGHYVGIALSGIQDAASAPTGLVGINTGSGKINKLTGGWRPKKFIILAARPGGGKTALALVHAKAAAMDKHHVAFISAEMPNEELVLRLISSECGISYDELSKGKYENGNPFSSDDWARIHKAGGFIESLPIHFYEGQTYDISNIIYWLMDMIQQYDIQLAIGDYVQIFTDRTVKGGELREVVASVSRKLKLFTTTTSVPFIALSQLSRDIDKRPNKRPMLTDLKESGQLEQDADLVIGLYRDDYYKLEEAKKNGINGRIAMPTFDNTLDYDFLKFRGGKLRLVRLWMDIGTNRMADEAPPPPVPAQPVLTEKYLSTYPAGVGLQSFGEPMNEEETQDAPF